MVKSSSNYAEMNKFGTEYGMKHTAAINVIQGMLRQVKARQRIEKMKEILNLVLQHYIMLQQTIILKQLD